VARPSSMRTGGFCVQGGAARRAIVRRVAPGVGTNVEPPPRADLTCVPDERLTAMDRVVGAGVAETLGNL
jgi:hypothetical protein